MDQDPLWSQATPFTFWTPGPHLKMPKGQMGHEPDFHRVDNFLVTFKNFAKGLHQAAREIGRITERRHTAIAIYANAMGDLKALDAGEK
jgi:hypothetical protein